MTNIHPKVETPKSDAQIASEVTGIMIGLEFRLKNPSNYLAAWIKDSQKNQMPGLRMIKEIKGMVEDNEAMMLDILGTDLLNQIKNFQTHVS